MKRLSPVQKQVLEKMRAGHTLRWPHLAQYPYLCVRPGAVGEPVTVATLDALLDRGLIVQHEDQNQTFVFVLAQQD